MARRSDVLEPGTRIEDYAIVSKIGAGAYGTVYSAEHTVIGKSAAIKVLSRAHSRNEMTLHRFLVEARAVNRVRHRGIVDIFSFGQLDDGRRYLVMELLEGMGLDHYLAEAGPLAPDETIMILRRVARALDAAHGVGIAHRDLKPENVFLTFDDGEVLPKLLDFGVAKLLTENAIQRTAKGQPVGTPLYMSPEQWRGKPVDQRADIFALGVMAFEMLTGRLPFEGETSGEIMISACTEEPIAASVANPSLSPALDRPLLAMLDKDPAGRPSGAGEAIALLEAAAARAGVARCPSQPSRVLQPSAAMQEAATRLGAQTETTTPVSQMVAGVAAPSRWGWVAVVVALGGLLAVLWQLGLERALDRRAPDPPAAASLAATTAVADVATAANASSATAPAPPVSASSSVSAAPPSRPAPEPTHSPPPRRPPSLGLP